MGNLVTMAQDDKAEQTLAEANPKSVFGIIVHSFFIIPFLIAVFCVILFTAISLLTREQQTAYDLLNDVKIGGLTKRWQAAFELSKILANPKLIPPEERFSTELIKAFRQSKQDDSRVRQYLALAMGRTGNSIYLAPLINGIAQEKQENLYAIIYALGMLKDPGANHVLYEYLQNPNARLRSLTVVAIGNIGSQNSIEYFKKALNDSEPNVKWGSAISLAKLGDSSGQDILLQLLSRNYFTGFPEVDPEEQTQLMLTAIDAATPLNLPRLTEQIRHLSTTDQNMKVRAKALTALGN